MCVEYIVYNLYILGNVNEFFLKMMYMILYMCKFAE